MKKFLVGLLVVALLVGIVIAAVVLFASAEFKPLAEKVLADCRDGKVEDVYAKASKAFKAESTLAQTKDVLAMWEKSLGAYKQVTKMTGAGTSASTSSATVGTVSLEIEYEKGTTTGEFRFVKEDGEWRLLSINVKIPEALQPKPDRAALEPLARDLVRLYDEKGFVALYDRFAPELREAWPAEKFQAEVPALREKTGKVVDVAAKPPVDAEDGKVRVDLDVTFENGKGTGSVKAIWRNLRWDVIAFSLEMGD